MHWLKQSTAITLKLGPFLDETDGKTAETGLTLSQADFKLSKNGGTFAQKNEATSATHDALGYYDVLLNTTDTNTLGSLRIAVHESGALPVWQDFMVTPANVWDSLFGADRLQVDVLELSSDSAAADNAESFFDGTGYAGTNNVIPTVTTTTTATNVTTVNGLSSAAVQAIWDALTSALTTVGSIGKLIVDNLNATVSSRSSHTAANVRTEMDSNSTQLAKLGSPAGASVSADIAAVKVDTAAILDDTGTSGVTVSSTGVAAIWAQVIEGSNTALRTMRILLSVMAGKSSGGGTTSIVFRDTGDTKDRVTATVDVDGNRSAVTLDGS